MDKTKIYDGLFWSALLVIAIWIFLKIIGVIHSPVWIEMIPYAGSIFAAGIFYQSVRSMRFDLSDLALKTRSIEERTNSLDKCMVEVKTDLKHVDSDLHYLKKKIK